MYEFFKHKDQAKNQKAHTFLKPICLQCKMAATEIPAQFSEFGSICILNSE